MTSIPASAFEESRRLTGANVWFADCGAALETAPWVTVDDALLAAWRSHVARAFDALGWRAGAVVALVHPGGASLAFVAPMDQLYAATEVNEWALDAALWQRTAALSDSGSTTVLTDADSAADALLPMDADLLTLARTLRQGATDAEDLMWRLLRHRQLLGCTFRRQQPMEPYVLDFFCHSLMLAVELDGGQHGDVAQVTHDARRAQFLEARGIETVRYWNHDVLARTEDVLADLHRRLELRQADAQREMGERHPAHVPTPTPTTDARSGACTDDTLLLQHAPGHAAAWDIDSAIKTLQATAAAEATPSTMALVNAARAHGIPALLGEELVTLGTGNGGQSWPEQALPAADAIPWHTLHAIPTALVTGSNGKTTTVRLLAAMANAHGWRTGFSSTDGLVVDGAMLDAGDYSGPIGARTVLRQPQIDAAILETARGGVLRRGLAVQAADVAVVTNVSADHFGEYGVFDIARLAQVKLTVAHAVAARGLLVLNGDDATLRGAATRLTGRIGWFALDADAPVLRDARAAGQPTCGVRDGHLWLERDDHVSDLGAVRDMPLSVSGRARYNIANLAGAALAASELGIGAATIAAVFARFGAENADNRGRLEHWSIDGVDVWLDYAHNPDGLAGLMEVVRGAPGQAQGRLGLLLGQAGNRLDDDLRALAATAARWQPARVVLKDIAGYERGRVDGAVAAVLRDALLEGGVPDDAIVYRGDETDAVRDLLAWAQPGDTLVLPVHGVVARRGVIEWLDGLHAPGTPR